MKTIEMLVALIMCIVSVSTAWAQNPPMPDISLDKDFTWFNVAPPPAGSWITYSSAPDMAAQAPLNGRKNTQNVRYLAFGPLTTTYFRSQASYELTRLSKPGGGFYKRYLVSYWWRMFATTPSENDQLSVDVRNAGKERFEVVRANDLEWRRRQFIIIDSNNGPLRLEFALTKGSSSRGLEAYVDCVHFMGIPDTVSSDFQIVADDISVSLRWNSLAYSTQKLYAAPTPAGPFSQVDTRIWPVVNEGDWRKVTIYTSDRFYNFRLQ
jgi:hypothetical protein